MSDKLRAAALLALDLLIEDDRNADRCICILEAALAKQTVQKSLTVAEQEPVGKFFKFSDGVWKEVTTSSPGQFLYTAPPRREWVGLTQTQVKLLREGVYEESIKTGDSIDWVFYTHINEALKEKNSE